MQGGDGQDTFVFAETVTGSFVSGDADKDSIVFNEVVNGGSSIMGGSGNDTISFANGATSVSILGELVKTKLSSPVLLLQVPPLIWDPTQISSPFLLGQVPQQSWADKTRTPLCLAVN